MSAGKPTVQSSVDKGGSAERAVDGNSDTSWGGNSCTHTRLDSELHEPFWRVDLRQAVAISLVRVVNREGLKTLP